MIGVDEFTAASLDEIKEHMRKQMEQQISNNLYNGSGSDLIHYGNVYTIGGEDLKDIGAKGVYLVNGEENVPLTMSSNGIGFSGKVTVEFADGKKDMDVIFAPVITSDMNDLAYSMSTTANGDTYDTGTYFLQKYGDPSLKDDSFEYYQDAYANIPDNVRDLIDTLANDPMGLDWDDLTPHNPDLTYVKSDTKENVEAKPLNDSLLSETSLTEDKQFGE